MHSIRQYHRHSLPQYQAPRTNTQPLSSAAPHALTQEGRGGTELEEEVDPLGVEAVGCEHHRRDAVPLCNRHLNRQWSN
eukprot:2949649-Rhodomonas_salina.1